MTNFAQRTLVLVWLLSSTILISEVCEGRAVDVGVHLANEVTLPNGLTFTPGQPEVTGLLARFIFSSFDGMPRDIHPIDLRALDVDKNHVVHVQHKNRNLYIYCLEYPLFVAQSDARTRTFVCENTTAFLATSMSKGKPPQRLPFQNEARPALHVLPGVLKAAGVRNPSEVRIVGIRSKKYLLSAPGSQQYFSIPRQSVLYQSRDIDALSRRSADVVENRRVRELLPGALAENPSSPEQVLKDVLRHNPRVVLFGEFHCPDLHCPHRTFMAANLEELSKRGFAWGLELPRDFEIQFESTEVSRAWDGRSSISLGEVLDQANLGQLKPPTFEEAMLRTPLAEHWPVVRRAHQLGMKLLAIDELQESWEAKKVDIKSPDSRDRFMAATIQEHLGENEAHRFAMLIGLAHLSAAPVPIRTGFEGELSYTEPESLLLRLRMAGVPIAGIHLNDAWFDSLLSDIDYLAESRTVGFRLSAGSKSYEFLAPHRPKSYLCNIDVSALDAMIFILPGSREARMRDALWDPIKLDYRDEPYRKDGVLTRRDSSGKIMLQEEFRNGNRLQIRTKPPWLDD